MKGQRPLLLKGAAWVTAAAALINMLSLVSLLILTRLLMPEDFGLVAIALAFSEIVSMITELSLTTALVQRRKLEQAHFDTAWTMNAIRATLFGVVVLMSAPFVAEAYGDPRLTLIIQSLAGLSIVSGLKNPKMVVFQRRLDFSKSFIMKVSHKLASFVVTVGVAIIYQSYWALIAGIFASELVTIIISYILMPYRPRFSLTKWRDLLSFSIWLTMGTWVQAVNWRAQPLLFGAYMPVNVLGQYNFGRRLAGRTISEAIAPIKAVLFPAFSRLQDDALRLRGGYMRSQGTICLVTFPIAAIFAVFAHDIVLVAVGEKWLPCVPVVQIMAVINMIQATQNVNALAMATDNTKALFFRELRSFFVRWPLVLGGLFMAGDEPFAMLYGAMLGQAVAVLVIIAWNITLIARISPITVRDHVSFIWRPMLAAGAMGGVITLGTQFGPALENTLEIAARLIVLGTLGIATYFATLFLLWIVMGRRESIEKELAHIIGDLFKKALARLRAA